MKRFADFIREQAPPMPGMGAGPPQQPPKKDPTQDYRMSPIKVVNDDAVVDALFANRSDVIGPSIKTSSNKVDDNEEGIVRIDLLNGRARLALAVLKNGVVSLATPGHMIDDTDYVRILRKKISDAAKAKGLRVFG